MHARSFPALATPGAGILILGSMPGQASLAAQQYYAHPRNAFWPIMGELFGAAPHLPYALRVAALARARVAVWDVLEACVRPGSLDADISADGLVANDFAGFFHRNPGISRVYFNGVKAAQLFSRFALPTLAGHQLAQHTLPSTSPAHARLTFAAKCDAWRVIVE